MTESILNILDNDCTKTSPCRNCHWHIQGIEKNRCIKICQKLSAYRDGLEYNHLPWPELKDLQDEETEDKIPPKNTKRKTQLSRTDQKKEKIGDSMPVIKKTPVKRNKDGIDKIVDDIAKRINKAGVPNPPKNMCVICKKNPIYNKRTKTCSACYQQFRSGNIEHPDEGKWESSWIQHRKVDKSVPKPQKPRKPDRDKVFKIYMNKYPGIMQYIVEAAEKSLLPTKDIFVQLLSEAIIARKENDKVSDKHENLLHSL